MFILIYFIWFISPLSEAGHANADRGIKPTPSQEPEVHWTVANICLVGVNCPNDICPIVIFV